MSLQERINELNNAIINYKGNKAHVTGFLAEDRLNEYLNEGKDAHFSYGIHDIENISFSDIKDNGLFVVMDSDKIIGKYRYTPIYNGIVKFKEYNDTGKKVTRTRVYTIRYCPYSNTYSYKDLEDSKVFNTLRDLKDFFNFKYSKQLDSNDFIGLNPNDEILEFKDSQTKSKYLKTWDLPEKQLYYRGVSTPKVVPCYIIGYLEKFTNHSCIDQVYHTLLIAIEGNILKISAAYIKEMQDSPIKIADLVVQIVDSSISYKNNSDSTITSLELLYEEDSNVKKINIYETVAPGGVSKRKALTNVNLMEFLELKITGFINNISYCILYNTKNKRYIFK